MRCCCTLQALILLAAFMSCIGILLASVPLESFMRCNDTELPLVPQCHIVYVMQRYTAFVVSICDIHVLHWYFSGVGTATANNVVHWSVTFFFYTVNVEDGRSSFAKWISVLILIGTLVFSSAFAVGYTEQLSSHGPGSSR